LKYFEFLCKAQLHKKISDFYGPYCCGACILFSLQLNDNWGAGCVAHMDTQSKATIFVQKTQIYILTTFLPSAGGRIGHLNKTSQRLFIVALVVQNK
jgi:hypothetical protein